MKEVKLMKGNEVIAHAAVRCGCDGYFGYPITPQSEVIETLMEIKPWETTGMVALQAESELAAINMVYGGAAAGKMVMTSSSSPGISLKAEGISYIAGAELPCVLLNVVRGGPGLGTIQPAQSDYFQMVKGGGHGDYKLIVLAPNSVQEMNDFVGLGFDLAFKYLNPVMILSDGIIGQMMERVVLSDIKPRRTDAEIEATCGEWATTGKKGRKNNIVTSLCLDSSKQELFNHKLQEKYQRICDNEARSQEYFTEDAEYLIVAYGSSARISEKAVEMARAEGIKVGLLRPITLFPFPKVALCNLAKKVKGILSVEMSTGQMVEDIKVQLYGESNIPVHHYGRCGGMIHSPSEVLEAIKNTLIK